MDQKITKKPGICPKCKKRNHPLAPDTEGDVCDECQDALMKNSSVIICNNCNHIAGFIQEGVSPEGFEFERGKIYHVDKCVKCSAFVTQFKIIELEDYLKSKGKSENKNLLEGM